MDAETCGDEADHRGTAVHFPPAYDTFGRLLPPTKQSKASSIDARAASSTTALKFPAVWPLRSSRLQVTSALGSTSADLRVRSSEEMKSSHLMREALHDRSLGSNNHTKSILLTKRKQAMVRDLDQQKVQYERLESAFLKGETSISADTDKHCFYTAPAVRLIVTAEKSDSDCVMRERRAQSPDPSTAELFGLGWKAESTARLKLLKERQERNLTEIVSKRKRRAWPSLGSSFNLAHPSRSTETDFKPNTRTDMVNTRREKYTEDAIDQNKVFRNQTIQESFQRKGFVRKLDVPYWELGLSGKQEKGV